MSESATFLQTAGGIFLIWTTATVAAVVAYRRQTRRPLWVSTLMFGCFALALLAALVILLAAAGVA